MANVHEWYKDEATSQYVHDVSVSVNAPCETCYSAWSNFEYFPNIMRHIEKVTNTSATTSHWEAVIARQHQSWDAETTELIANEVIAWRSTNGLRNSGSVRFSADGLGCRITVHIMYDPPYGMIGDLVAERRVNDDFHRDLVEDLLQFKEAVESGQIKRYRRAA